MKPSVFAHAGWVLFGATLVLLIGALAKFVPDSAPPKTVPVAEVTPAPTGTQDDSADATNEAPLPANFPANLAQVVKLTRAGLREDVILAYVQGSGEHYAPTADEMIYLHQCGVPEAVMAALVRQKPKPPPAPVLASQAPDSYPGSPSQTPADESVNRNAAQSGSSPAPVENPASPPPAPRPLTGAVAASFYDDLAPYGDWIQTSDSNWAWQPTIEQAVPNWQPYRDDGQWQLTDSGWYWQSSYPWGWAAFHYGAWYNDPSRGWLWQPGSSWAPAWVAWRKTSTHFGWAPLPPGVSFNAEFAVQPNNLADYGFSPSSYTFVPTGHFLSHNLAKYSVSVNVAATLLASSVSVGGRNQKFGFQPEEVAAAVHRPIPHLTISDASAPTTRNQDYGSRELAVYRPNVNTSLAARLDSTSSKANR